MRLRTYAVLLGLALLVISGLLSVPADAAGVEGGLIQELYEKSGMQEELFYIAPGMIDEFDRSIKELDPSDRAPEDIIKASKELMTSSFSAENLKGHVFSELEASLSESEIRAVIEWLDTPLGKKATKLEIESSKPEAEPDIQAFVAEVDKNPLPSARMDLIVGYERTVGLADATTSMILGMQLATGIALNSIFSPLEEQKSPSELSEAVEKNRTMMEGKIRPELLSRLAYTYRGLSDSDLGRLIEFESSELGRKYTRASFSAVQKAMVEATGSFSKSLLQVIKESKEKEKPAA